MQIGDRGDLDLVLRVIRSAVANGFGGSEVQMFGHPRGANVIIYRPFTMCLTSGPDRRLGLDRKFTICSFNAPIGNGYRDASNPASDGKAPPTPPHPPLSRSKPRVASGAFRLLREAPGGGLELIVRAEPRSETGDHRSARAFRLLCDGAGAGSNRS